MKGDAFAREELQYRRILYYADRISAYLYAKVEIAQTPRDAGALLERGNGNFQHFFGRLLNDVVSVANGKKVGAMVYRLVEIKTKFLSVLGDAAPATLGESRSINGYPHMDMMTIDAMRVRVVSDDSEFRHEQS